MKTLITVTALILLSFSALAQDIGAGRRTADWLDYMEYKKKKAAAKIKKDPEIVFDVKYDILDIEKVLAISFDVKKVSIIRFKTTSYYNPYYAYYYEDMYYKSMDMKVEDRDETVHSIFSCNVEYDKSNKFMTVDDCKGKLEKLKGNTYAIDLQNYK